MRGRRKQVSTAWWLSSLIQSQSKPVTSVGESMCKGKVRTNPQRVPEIIRVGGALAVRVLGVPPVDKLTRQRVRALERIQAKIQRAAVRAAAKVAFARRKKAT